jgi:hypothetical protein
VLLGGDVAAGSSCGRKIPVTALVRVLLGGDVGAAAAGAEFWVWFPTSCWYKIPPRFTLPQW